MSVEKLRQSPPLVVCITNDVVKDFTANGMLALGASPIMSGEKSEAGALMKAAGGLLINIGTADVKKKELMLEMVEAANHNNVPVILDPVGYAASDFRKNLVDELIDTKRITLIKGNAGEIHALAGETGGSRGVDSTEEKDTLEIAQLCYNKLNIPVLVTGETDAFVSDKDEVVLKNGHELLGKITGSGCLLGAVVSAFISREDTLTEAVINAVSYFNLSAEHAAGRLDTPAPGSFRTAFIDSLYLNDDRVLEGQKVTYID